MRFLHAADIHLDSPLRGLERYEGAPVEAIRLSTRRAFENLINLALAEDVAFVLIAGDLYDGDWEDYNTGLYFCAQVARLQKRNIPVFLIAGNHDAESRMTRRLDLPKNVHLFPSQQPSTIRLEELRVAIHGQSFAQQAVELNLAEKYPPPVSGYLNIGMLHTSATGRAGHAPYAPCRIEDLLARGYDYWALGHVHNREILHADPPIVFPGNIQGRHIREVGPKGCTLVTAAGRGPLCLEERVLDVLRWEHWRLDARQMENARELLDAAAEKTAERTQAAEGRILAVRLEIMGATALHQELAARGEHWQQQFRARVAEESAGAVWIEKVQFCTQPVLTAEEHPKSGPIGELLDVIDAIDADDEKLSELAESLADLHSKLPRELRDGEDAIDLLSPANLRVTVREVRELLLHGLLHGEEAL